MVRCNILMSISVTLYFHATCFRALIPMKKVFFFSPPFFFIVVYRGWENGGKRGKKGFLEILESIVRRENTLDFPFLIF